MMHSIMSFCSCGIPSCLALDWIDLVRDERCLPRCSTSPPWRFGWQAPRVWSSRSSILTLLLNWGIREFLLLCDWGYLRIVDQANCTILNVFGLSGNFFIKAKGAVWWYWLLDLPCYAAIVFLVSIVLSLILLCFFTFSDLSNSKLLDAKLFVFTAILTQMRENDWEFGYVYYAQVICQVQELDTSGTSRLASLLTTNAGWSR